MTNHIHLIISRKPEGEPLSAIVRDFKKFTSSQLTKAIETTLQESRRNWMIWLFSSAAKKNTNNSKYQFWKQDSHAEQLISNKFMDQKLEYIHQNPVVAGLVDRTEDFRYSSARDYAGKVGLLDVILIG